MKKNKKYWKEEAKSWREVARIESEEANNWAAKAIDLQEQVDQLQNELNVLRRYNIGKKSESNGFAQPIWQVPPYGQTYPQTTVTTGTGWSKNIPAKPFKCNCKGCNCK